MADDAVIDALLAAVDADPENVAVRTHLARLLVDASRHEEALEQASIGLKSEPGNEDLLAIVKASAGELGARSDDTDSIDEDDTDGSLDAGDETDDPETRIAAPIALGPDVIPDTVDELIDEWADSEPLEEPEVGHLSISDVKLEDVGGMQTVKDRLRLSFLGPLENPEMQAAFGKSMRGGLMLWGPPGCGKTFIARAVAGELGAKFYEVGLADVLDMWIGSSERNLRAIFDVARANRPCVLFFDEIDALGMKRTHLRGGGAAMRGVVNQLLTEMDGVSSDNDGVFILAATNHPWDVDAALTRPGRLDRTLLVLPPDEAARLEVLGYHLKDKPVADDVDLTRIASITEGLTGADLALVCDSAIEEALADSMRSGEVRPISMKRLTKAAKSVRPSIGGWLETARNHATFANSDGTYDELLTYMRRRK